MASLNPKWLLGRTIVAVEMNPAKGNGSNGQTTHDPVIFLDNGACISFLAQETESGDGYGIAVFYTAKARDPNPDAARLRQRAPERA